MYSADIDLTNDNDSHSLMVRLVGRDRRVLDLGCADGSVGRALVSRGCTVWGVELDPEAAAIAKESLEDVVVGDLETLDLAASFGDLTFDAILCGDVLEHVRDPGALLQRVLPLVAPEGCIVASVPNIAHGGVRLALLTGSWSYQDRGLLDRTHLRFFTRRSLLELLDDSGLIPLEVHRTTVGIFEGEVHADPHAVPPDAVALVEDDPDAVTYQFVVKAVPDRPGSELAVSARRVAELTATLEQRADATADLAEAQELSRAVEAREAAALAQVDLLSRQLTEAQEALEEQKREVAQLSRQLVVCETHRARADELLAQRADERLLRLAKAAGSRFRR